MADPLAIVPARAGSKGIPGKNFTNLAGRSPVWRAIDVVEALGWSYVVSTDIDHLNQRWLKRPPELAQDTTPMIDVVRHVLAEIPGPPDQIVILVQPTQPLRTPEHLKAAIALLKATPGADSVVSVVPLPQTHHPDFVCRVTAGRLRPFNGDWSGVAAARQLRLPVYLRDGTVYACYRRTIATYGNLYGAYCVPLIMHPDETCPLDDPADWAEAERRLSIR